MMTGLEPVVAKACGSAATKAVGWGFARARVRFAERKVHEALVEPVSVKLVGNALGRMPSAAVAALSRFVESPELEHLAFELATDHLLHACGRKVANKRVDLQEALRENVRLVAGISDSNTAAFADALFEAVDAAVIVAIGALHEDGEELPDSLRASLIKTAAALGTTGARNSELLASLEDISLIRKFENDYRSQVSNVHRSMRLPHAGTTRQVPYERLFVQPNVLVTSQKLGEDGSMTIETVSSYALRVVMLGNPGGGKSTSSLKLTYDIASGKSTISGVTTPFLIVLRNYAERIKTSKLSLIDYIDELCKMPYGIEPPEGALEYLLLNGRAFIIFDGLDELLDVGLRRDVVQAVEAFAYRYPTASILVTSREVGYTEAALDPDLFTLCVLQAFNDEQVEAYVRRWFSLDESIELPRKAQLAESFLIDSRFVSDLRINPLMLSLMCGIYASESYIPRNRPDVYEKCALLLFERWDRQRDIKVPLAFDAHVQAALRALALWMYPQQETQVGLPRDRLISFMKQYLLEKRFDNAEEAENAAVQFIEFCKGRAWVLTDVGAETYGFTHRTFLEYFAASQLVRLNPSAEGLFGKLRPHIELAEWDMLALLALQILGETVEDGADDFLELLVSISQELAPTPRANALSFAARSLEFVVPRPPVLRRIVESAFAYVDPAHEEIAPLADLLKAAPENLAIIRRYLADCISEALADHVNLPVLEFALKPWIAFIGRSGVDYRLHRYWQNETFAHLPLVRTCVNSTMRHEPWVGRWALTSRLLQLTEYLAVFGASDWFGDVQGPRAITRALSTMLLLSQREREPKYPTWLDKRNAQAAVVLFHDTLPWPRPRRRNTFFRLGYLRPSSIRIAVSKTEPPLLELIVLSVMGLSEMEEHRQSVRRGGSEAQRAMRERDIVRMFSSTERLEELQGRLTEPTRDVVSRWTQGALDLWQK